MTRILFGILSTCLISLVSLSVIGQDKVWFLADFDRDAKGWKIENNEIFQSKISGGNYNIQVKSKNVDRLTMLNDVYIDQEKDFIIECNIKLVTFAKSKFYGFVWGAKDKSNLYSFTVNSEKYFSIDKYENEKRKVLRKKEICTAIDSLDGFNKLVIEKKNNELLFYINNRKVHSSDFMPFMGTKIGFEVGGKFEVSVDNIVVIQDNKINTVSNESKGLIKENLGPNVNSVHQDVVPVISHDGKTLYYHVVGDDENIGDNPQYGDIWYSTLKEDSTWNKRKNIGKPLNNSLVNFIFSVSPDNNSLLLYGHYDEMGEYLGEGISISNKTTDNWSIPKAIVIDNFYNNNFFNDYCLSPNRKVLIHSIERKDSYGDRDLYVSFLKENEEWTEPKNLGPVVNSVGTELTPFLSADGATLYYSTNGKPGYGQHDVFVTRRLNDDWTEWSEPQNMGDEINTPEWDAYYTIPASAEHAYMVSEQNSIGKKDIFSMRLPEELKPQPVLLIYGKVLNSKTKEPLQADIAYNNLTTDEELGIATSDPADGSYKLILPIGHEYSFLATKKDYISQSENVDARNITEYTEIERDLYLTPIEVGQVVRLNNIFFDFDKATLRPESYPELGRVVKLLNTSKTVKIELSGHTDDKGSDDYNKKLSQKRVNVVRDYLIEKGISPDRLTAKGYGESRPQTTNDTEEGRQMNRRTEFKILSK